MVVNVNCSRQYNRVVTNYLGDVRVGNSRYLTFFSRIAILCVDNMRFATGLGNIGTSVSRRLRAAFYYGPSNVLYIGGYEGHDIAKYFCFAFKQGRYRTPSGSFKYGNYVLCF